MTQEELEALLRQIAPNSDPRRLEFSESTGTVETEDPGSGLTEGTRRKVPVRVLTWTDRGTGRTLRVQQDPGGGGYTKLFDGIDPKMQGEPATKPGAIDPDAPQAGKPYQNAQGQWVQPITDAQGNVTGTRPVPPEAIPRGEKPSGPTTAQAALTGYPGWTAQRQKDAQGNEVEVYIDPQGAVHRSLPAKPEAPKEPDLVGKPTGNARQRSENGTTVKEVEYALPDGTREWRSQTATEVQQPESINLPPTQKWHVQRNPDGTFTTTKNPNYRPPSQITQDKETGQWIQITEDENGAPLIRPVNSQTVIQPADIPALQTQYGQISQRLGDHAATLRAMQARGELTAQQFNDAWQQAHQQASVAVQELNNILDNSRATWAAEITQRGQTLADTQGRRAFAQSMASDAVRTGASIALSAGPGHGAKIARGVGALMTVGARYAEGLGAFRESPEIAMPVSLQQARDTPLPGLPLPQGRGAAGAGAGSVLGPVAAAAAQAPQYRPGPETPLPPPPSPSPMPTPETAVPGRATDLTDASGAPREFTPASSSPSPVSLPQPGARQVQIRDLQTGQVRPEDPAMAQELVRRGAGRFEIVGTAPSGGGMGARLAARSPMGVPVSAGGGGLFDLDREAQGMAAAAPDDPMWLSAVSRARDVLGQYG